MLELYRTEFVFNKFADRNIKEIRLFMAAIIVCKLCFLLTSPNSKSEFELSVKDSQIS